jgi:site-specific DNA recombinase
VPSGPNPVLTEVGEQGSAKSTLGRLTRRILDPNKAALRSQPRDERDLVSVTHQFNTATSMGRLILNVLLSLAQFEREIIS